MGAEKKWLFTLFSVVFVSVLLLLLYSISAFSSAKPFPSAIRHGAHYPPSFAYYITGGRGDKDRIFRLLLAVYHPRNRYLLHLSADATDDERLTLVTDLKSVAAVNAFGNVDVLGKADRLSHMGGSHTASTLHAVSILLKLDPSWNWFIQLSAFDYPLLTQDDLSHVFSSVNRNLSFIDHTSDLGWKESQRIQPIVVDPALYLARRTQLFTATEKRPTPDAFKVFTGSPWIVLSRSFLEYCIFGWDNLPRILLMYFNNVVLSEECYFHTVICNAPEFRNSAINGDLRYMIWDSPPKMEPHFLNVSDYEQMAQSGSAFARQFQQDDPVLDMIDREILKRGRYRVTPGAWCSRHGSWWTDSCSQWDNVNVVKPGPQAKKLEETITNLLDDWNSQANQCK
ncbi:PREDICTED: beta-glucuronosyltransferase GlcAT14A [Tarenaya hassleriana]|uniref:beta-glucuronosyltransferase GlcAT14A n=1 Tax=Tarenaya hassleriana TaxID=28532 RepID=UPI00053C3E9B|nr:PREDICTED: beta-glucuronosyltransferase GlcAT14A [Tarenaya hassleriana]